MARIDMRIRFETPADRADVHAVNSTAFESSAEADLVDELRGKARPQVSLVAEWSGSVVGHILFSPVTIAGRSSLSIMGLAPLAVLPEYQRRGVGSALVREGLRQCADAGCDAVVVLGHRDFYPRFGFVPASRFDISCEYDVPDDAFMALELRPGALRGMAGRVIYDEAFGRL